MSTVQERYVDALGNERVVPAATRAAFNALLREDDAPPLVPPAMVLRRTSPIAFTTLLPAASWCERIAWRVTCEDGAVLRGNADLQYAPVLETLHRDGGVLDRRSVALPDLPLGYHRLAVDAGAYGTAESALIVVPGAAAPPPQPRAWGIAVQLYTIRSPRNWGIGDFGDLRRIVAIAAAEGAAYVGLNPLHATHRTDPEAASPYAPTSRRFLSWLAIDVAALPDAQDVAIAGAIADAGFQAQLAALRATPLVDYTGVAACKERILRRCFAVFMERGPDAAFRTYVAAGGAALERFAIFEALVRRYGRDVAAWPAAYRDPATADVRAFADAERAEVVYGLYLQWRATQQLALVAAEGAGRGVALYRDLAVGVDANGADVWVDPGTYVPSASVGAPPDVLNPGGQDWGLPPLGPRTLPRDGYRAVADLFRENMAYAGALRIDHAMSLMRLFWIPRGARAADGGYVPYPLEDVLGILALESVRAHCVVIGEDLGTVPAGFRERMASANVLSYRILFFERAADGGFVRAEEYPALALAATGTHDLAPFAAWLSGTDIALRERLGVIDAPFAAQERAEREGDRRRLIGTLIQSGDLAAREPEHDDVVVAAHRFLGRSPAAIVMMQIDDAVGEAEPVNVPGTSSEYPNWRRKLSADLEAIAADARFQKLCATLREQRPRPT
ncbi:MAG: 4-alpha-glucanotransferase [Candidatus Velthaea sp.]